MNTSEDRKPLQKLGISAEAMIGIGITLGCLGLLGLLLGWAQQMRQIPAWATMWFVLGAVFTIGGFLLAAIAGARRRGR